MNQLFKPQVGSFHLSKRYVSYRTKSTKQWYQRHMGDPYVKKSLVDNYRARSAYKLIEILEKFSVLKNLPRAKTLARSSKIFIDLGAAPGSWGQVLQQKYKFVNQKRIIGIDLLEFEPLEGVERFQGDFFDQETWKQLDEYLQGEKAELIVSDCAPSFSGTRSLDHFRSHELNLNLVTFCQTFLKPGGWFISKYIGGEHQKEFHTLLQTNFQTVFKPFKPKASRKESSEIFFIAHGFLLKVKKEKKLEG